MTHKHDRNNERGGPRWGPARALFALFSLIVNILDYWDDDDDWWSWWW